PRCSRSSWCLCPVRRAARLSSAPSKVPSPSPRRGNELRRNPLGPRLVVQIDPRGVLATPGERRPELLEPPELQRQVVRAKPHLLQAGGIARERGEPARLLDPHFLQRRGGQPFGPPRLEQMQRGVE